MIVNIRVHVTITGRVQGVFFRANTKAKAQQLGLFGWVRNQSDGSVEAIFEGPEPQVNKMITWCHQGPSHAMVSHVKLTKQQYLGEFQDFLIKY
jgi:acylphosphatase